MTDQSAPQPDETPVLPSPAPGEDVVDIDGPDESDVTTVPLADLDDAED